MNNVYALLIFAAMAAASWYVSVALLRSTFGEPSPFANPDFNAVSASVIGVVAITSLLHFPWGYFAGLIVWACAAFGSMRLPAARASVLFAYLAVGSLLTRAAALGVMEMFLR